MNEIEQGTTLLEALESSISASASQPEIVPPAEGGAPPSTDAPAVDPDAIDPQWTPGAQERIRALIAERNTEREKAAAIAEFEPWKPLIEKFKAEGQYNSFAEFEAAMAQQQAEQAQERQITQKLAGRANEIMSQVKDGYADPNTGEWVKLDMAAAERMFELEKKAVYGELRQSATDARLMKIELDGLAVKPEYANMDADWVAAMAKANPTLALTQIAAESHARITRQQQDFLAKHNAAKAADVEATKQQPAGGGTGAPVSTGAPDAAKDPKGYIQWMDAQAAASANR